MNLHSWVKVEPTLKINILRYLLSRKPRTSKDSKRLSQSVISCFGDNSMQRNTLEYPYQIQHCFKYIYKLFLKTVFNLFCEIGFK